MKHLQAEYIINNSQAEIKAIEEHIHKLDQIHGSEVLDMFDGKVINKRFTDKLKELTDVSISLDGLQFTLFSHEYIRTAKGNSLRATYYRSATFKLHAQENDPRRLDAEKTRQELETYMENLHAQLSNYQIAESEIRQADEKLQAIHKQFRELYKGTTNQILKGEIAQAFRRLT